MRPEAAGGATAPGSARGLPVAFRAADGYTLRGHVWAHGTGVRPVVIVNPATSVLSRYYARFAAWLHAAGMDVLTYDYRGIGGSRPPRLRGFEAGWIDWGRLDFEAALEYAAGRFPGQPLQVVGHSVGGFVIGMAASAHRLSRIVTVGAQHAYWRDYAARRRLGMLLRWHVAMPALTALLGYFPGRRLGWLEDTPRGVVRDWTASCARYDDIWRRGRHALPESELAELRARFAAVTAPMLALSVDDDPFGTVAAVGRLLDCYGGAQRTHLHLDPRAIGAAVGHFAFFHDRFAPTLWPIALAWLRDGRLPPEPPGRIVDGGPSP